MPTNKPRYTIYLSEDSKTKLDAIISIQKLQPVSGRSAAIEKAIDFYFGFLSSQLSMDYLCGVFGKQIEAIVNNATSRLSSIQFKQAVETNLLTRICALDYNFSTDEYSKMRSKAVDAVKKSNGRIGLFDTVNESDLD